MPKNPANRLPPAVLAAVLSTAGQAALAVDAVVPYPKDYRTWQHVKSMVIEPGHELYASFGGIHHLYANAEAMTGYASGTFPDGAVIAFDLLDVVTGGNAVQEGPRKVLGVMHKDARKYAATGGWGFEGFAAGDPAQRVVGDQAATACFGCHTSQKASDYVFSKPR